MNQKFSYIQSFKIIVLALLIAVGTGYLFADWTEPTTLPPNCPAGSPGCDAPINTSINSQDKLGRLRVNTSTINPFATGLEVFGKSIFTKGPNDDVAVEVTGTVDKVAVDVTGTIKATGLVVTGGLSGQVLVVLDDNGTVGWQYPQAPTAGVTPPTCESNETLSFANGNWICVAKDTGPANISCEGDTGGCTKYCPAGKKITNYSCYTYYATGNPPHEGQVFGLGFKITKGGTNMEIGGGKAPEDGMRCAVNWAGMAGNGGNPKVKGTGTCQ